MATLLLSLSLTDTFRMASLSMLRTVLKALTLMTLPEIMKNVQKIFHEHSSLRGS